MDSVGPVEIGDCRALPDFSHHGKACGKLESLRQRRQASLFPIVPSLFRSRLPAEKPACGIPDSGEGIHRRTCRQTSPVVYAGYCPQAGSRPESLPMPRVNLHLVSDSTGETLEMIAKAALAQFEQADVQRHFWPMVRSKQHLDRIVPELAAKPGLVIFTLVNPETRARLEEKCRHLQLPAVPVLDAVTEALEAHLGQEAHGKPGRQHAMDEAYFDRVDAIQYTIAHDDGVGHENWEEADIVLAGVSRTSKTPTSIYLANRGYKTANIPIVPQSPPPESLFGLRGPMVVGLTTAPDRLVQIRRNRLLSLHEDTDTAYVQDDQVKEEVKFARRMFADNGWPVIDVTRRSIEETAAAVIRLLSHRKGEELPSLLGSKPI